jgi:hypothetical protein
VCLVALPLCVTNSEFVHVTCFGQLYTLPEQMLLKLYISATSLALFCIKLQKNTSNTSYYFRLSIRLMEWGDVYIKNRTCTVQTWQLHHGIAPIIMKGFWRHDEDF